MGESGGGANKRHDHGDMVTTVTPAKCCHADGKTPRGSGGLDSEAEKFIRAMSARGDWVVKNPQFCMTLPYWKRFLPLDTRYLVCVRNPADAAMSMKRQRNIDWALGLEIWFNCTMTALKNTEGQKRMVVFYDDYFAGESPAQRDWRVFGN